VEVNELNGLGKVAILLMVMGEEFAANVFKHMQEKEVRAIGEQMAEMNNVEPKAISSVLNEFMKNVKGGAIMGGSGESFFERSVSKAFDPKKANSFLVDVKADGSTSFFEQLESLSPEMLVNFLSSEHPQTIALIFSNLNNQIVAEAIKLLPEGVQDEVIMRIAKLDSVPDAIVNEVHEILSKQVSDVGKVGPKVMGGIEVAAEILNQVDRKTEQAILDKIEEAQEDLAEEIRQSMFIFQDLINLDDRSVRALLKEVSNEELTLALKTASESLQEKILGNLSQRAAEMLKEDMEVMGPVKISEVEQAQQSIIKTARRLEEEGKVVLGGKGGEELV
jgi:flagellar motor switch protein FliG